MNAEEATIYNSCETKVVESLGAKPPDIDRTVLAETLVIKTIYLTNLTTFVITTEKSNTIRVSNFQTQKKKPCFDTVVAPVYIIAHKQIASLWTVSSDAKQFA